MDKKKIGAVVSVITMMLCVILIITEMAYGNHQFRVGSIITYISLFLFAAFLFYRFRKQSNRR
jgi:uncharacterized membrane protein